jgi:hypothetical protein
MPAKASTLTVFGYVILSAFYPIDLEVHITPYFPSNNGIYDQLILVQLSISFHPRLVTLGDKS